LKSRRKSSKRGTTRCPGACGGGARGVLRQRKFPPPLLSGDRRCLRRPGLRPTLARSASNQIAQLPSHSAGLRLFQICPGGAAAIRRGGEKAIEEPPVQGIGPALLAFARANQIHGDKITDQCRRFSECVPIGFSLFPWIGANRRTSTCNARTGWRNSGLNPWRSNAPGASAGWN